MSSTRVAVFLPDAQNPYYQSMNTEALETAGRLGMEVDVAFAGSDFFTQVRQIHNALSGSPRPDVVAVMAVQEAALKGLAERVTASGAGWVCLNRKLEKLAELRTEHPELPIGLVAPDQIEAGRIQARQVRTLLTGGGHVLYVQGRATNASSEQRARGFKEVTAFSAAGIEIVGTIDGNWMAADARVAAAHWLSMMLPAGVRVDAVVCQNDFMAAGVRQELCARTVDNSAGLARIPVLGCDGVLSVGCQLVNDGELAATVVLPTTTARALEAIHVHFSGGSRLPPEILLPPTPYPDEALMVRRWRHVA